MKIHLIIGLVTLCVFTSGCGNGLVNVVKKAVKKSAEEVAEKEAKGTVRNATEDAAQQGVRGASHLKSLAKDFADYFEKMGKTLTKRGRPGKHEPDYDVVDKKTGEIHPLEEKLAAESAGSPSSWWSFWKGKLEGLYSKNLDTLSTRVKGWVATIDGELREWCVIATPPTKSGFLRIEKAGASFSADGKTLTTEATEALEFLKMEGRISDYTIEMTESGDAIIQILFK